MSFYLSTAPNTTVHLCVTQPKTASAKPLLVFLHYWGGSSSTWHKLTSTESATSLSCRYPTIAVDLRGWGMSSGSEEDSGSPYSAVKMATDIVSVLSQLKNHPEHQALLAHGFVLVGHSMGAKVALATISYLPVHLFEGLKGLVLAAPAPPTALILPPDMKSQQKLAYESEDSVRWTVTNVLANLANLSDGDMEIVVRDSLAGNRLAKTAWPSYGMEEDISQDVKAVLSPLAKNIRVRVLTGELDVVEPRDRVESQVCRFLEDVGVQVSFRSVPGVKHLIPLEAPEAVFEEVSHF
ncbi:Alpha/Beta hydrolase protein [Aspergillus varians]